MPGWVAPDTAASSNFMIVSELIWVVVKRNELTLPYAMGIQETATKTRVQMEMPSVPIDAPGFPAHERTIPQWR
ncbi:MAG: hypothetical protein ACOZEN_10495 [Thermodesulfobacteriota bacterium]